MVTTFFGAHSFGGDAAYVDRLCQALCRRGHEVHVFHCVDAFNAVRGNHPLRPYTPPPGLHVHPLESGFGILSPLATQITGRPFFKAEPPCGEALDAADTDVVHFHNISLVGGPGVLRWAESPCGPDHDGARALADLPDAPALEIRPQGRATARPASAAAWRASGRRRPGGTPGRSSGARGSSTP